MATRSGRSLMQDQNSTGITVMGTNKGFPKAKPGGRKPLGDLSNAEKLAGRQALKQLGSKSSTYANEETIPSKVTKDTSRNRTIKASGKLQTGGRKVLSDISNYGKPCVQGTTDKLHVKGCGSKEEEPYQHDAIGEERFLHDHQECMKANSKRMDIGKFLETIGLDKGMFLHGPSPSVVPATSKLQVSENALTLPENCLKHLEMKDMEELCEIQYSSTECSDLINSSPPWSPLSSPISTWKSYDVNFKLMETPQVQNI